MRMLLGLIMIFAFLLYEVDRFMIILTADILQTGKVWGDLILNLGFVVNYSLLILAIYYRDEVMSPILKLIGAPPIIYIPTRADVMQLYLARAMLAFTLVVTAYMGYIAYEYFEAVELGRETLGDIKLDEYRDASNFFVQYISYLGTFKLLTLVLTTHNWTHKKMGDKRPSYKQGF